MILIQIKSSDGVAELWFGRRMETAAQKQNDKNLRNRVL